MPYLLNRNALFLLLGWVGGLAAIVGGGTYLEARKAALPVPVFSDIDYAGFSPTRNTLDLYLPEAGNGRPPLVVWIHGGGWYSGDKDHPVALRRLLKEGFAVASINYRLSTEAKWPAQLEDVGGAIRMLRGNGNRLGYDGSRIALFGASAGGHLAATAGLAFASDPTARVSAVVDWYGPTDLSRLDADFAILNRKSAEGPAAHPQSWPSRLIGASVAQQPALAHEAGPMSYVENLTAPPPLFLILHGDADELVAPAQSARLYKALVDRHGTSAADYVLFHGGEHGLKGLERHAAEDKTIKFLKAALRP